MTNSHKLLFLVTEDWYFVSHRLALAVEAARAGYAVSVATRVRTHGERITQNGIRLIAFELGRRVTNPLAELAILWRLVRLYRRVRPTIVYHVGMKPVVYGSAAARIAGIAGRINAISGLGFVFTSRHPKAKLLRPFLKAALRMLLAGRNCRIIVQNRDDLKTVTDIAGGDASKVVLVPGAGVDTVRFARGEEPPGVPLVLFAGRMLWDKGVGEFVAAAELLRSRGCMARFVLVGVPDDGNPTTVPVTQLEDWQRSGAVEWWGQREDMPAIFAGCHVVCLPSMYGEGIPKVLIEAAACGRAIVTTDIPGCREIVRHGVNGLLVPPRDVEALADALATLIADPAKRRAMGEAGRRIAEAEYGLAEVNRQSLAVIASVTE